MKLILSGGGSGGGGLTVGTTTITSGNANAILYQSASGATVAQTSTFVYASGSASNTQGQSGSEVWGASAINNSYGSTTIIGASAAGNGTGATVYGNGAAAGGYGLAAGPGATVVGNNADVALGYNASSTGGANAPGMAIGALVTVTAGAACIGAGGSNATSGSMALGGKYPAITKIFLGNGDTTSSAVSDVTISPSTTTAAATNGANLWLTGGAGTGTAGQVGIGTSLMPSAAGTSGNVLTSNGTNWTSTAPPMNFQIDFGAYGSLGSSIVATSGTWVVFTDNSAFCGKDVTNANGAGGSHANGDKLTLNNLNVPTSGNWSVYLVYDNGTDGGKVDVAINGGAALGTVDMYKASENSGLWSSAISLGSLTAGTSFNLSFTLNGHSAGSTSYVARLWRLIFVNR